MNVNLSIVCSGFFNEGNGIIKYALDLLSNVIFQMIFFVFNMIIEIVSAIICGTIYDVGNAILL